MFIGGNDADAKKLVTQICEALGWEVADLGGIEASRYLEPMCLTWVVYGIRTGSGITRSRCCGNRLRENTELKKPPCPLRRCGERLPSGGDAHRFVTRKAVSGVMLTNARALAAPLIERRRALVKRRSKRQRYCSRDRNPVAASNHSNRG